MLSSALAVKNSLNEGIAKYARADVSISKTQSSDSIYYDEDEMGNDSETNDLLKKLEVTDGKSIEDVYSENNVDLGSYFSDYVDVHTYTCPALTIRNYLGDEALIDSLGIGVNALSSYEGTEEIISHPTITRLQRFMTMLSSSLPMTSMPSLQIIEYSLRSVMRDFRREKR